VFVCQTHHVTSHSSANLGTFLSSYDELQILQESICEYRTKLVDISQQCDV